MKRKTLLILSLFVAAIVVFTGCKKEDPTSLVLDTSKSATISGTAYAELDYSESGNEKAPSGIKLFVTVNNSDYINGAQGVTIIETTVGSGGAFSVNVPVTDEGITITISAEDFSYDVVQYDGTSTETTIFIGGDMTSVYSAVTNGNYIRNFSF